MREGSLRRLRLFITAHTRAGPPQLTSSFSLLFSSEHFISAFENVQSVSLVADNPPANAVNVVTDPAEVQKGIEQKSKLYGILYALRMENCPQTQI